MLFSLLSSAGVQGVLVLPFFTVGLELDSGGSSLPPPVPPGSPYADPVAVAVSKTVLEPGAFRFLDDDGALGGASMFNSPVTEFDSGMLVRGLCCDS